MLRMRLKPLSETVKLAFDWMVNYADTKVTEEQNDQELILKIEKHSNRYFTMFWYLTPYQQSRTYISMRVNTCFVPMATI